MRSGASPCLQRLLHVLYWLSAKPSIFIFSTTKHRPHFHNHQERRRQECTIDMISKAPIVDREQADATTLRNRLAMSLRFITAPQIYCRRDGILKASRKARLVKNLPAWLMSPSVVVDVAKTIGNGQVTKNSIQGY
jgi:hypothetical protein